MRGNVAPKAWAVICFIRNAVCTKISSFPAYTIYSFILNSLGQTAFLNGDAMIMYFSKEDRHWRVPLNTWANFIKLLTT